MTSTVIIASFNGARFIKAQINSIILQSRKPDFILVCDDGSSDGTIVIIDELLSKSGIKYKIVVNESSMGVTRNFINAANMTETDVVFFCDQDDIWDTKKIECVLQIFENDNQCVEVFSNVFIWKSNQNTVNKSELKGKLIKYPDKITTNIDCSVDNNVFWSITIRKNVVQGMSMAIRSDVISFAAIFLDNYKKSITDEPLFMYHDSFYNLVAGSLGKVYYIDEGLAFYRQHSNNVIGGIHRFNISALKRAETSVEQSFKKHKERMIIIDLLNSEKHFLDNNNRSELENCKLFYKNRELYIDKGNIIQLVKLSKHNRWYYSSKGVLARDLIVAALKKIELIGV